MSPDPTDTDPIDTPIGRDPTSADPSDQSVPEISSRQLLYLLVGAALLVSVGVLVLASGLIAPLWAALLLDVAWLGAAIVSVVQWRRRPFLPLLAGLGIGILWVFVIAVGNAFLGWQP